LDGKSEDILKDKVKELKKLFPEAVAEGKVDFEQLKATLGDEINSDNERYVLSWAGKAEAFRVLQQPTTATLAPAPKESVNFDTTENIFIEGENLEVLKVLQKSYYGKIKMIYIDPPYNTGNDSFIYPDKFAESKDEYLKRIGEKDEEGYLLKEGLFRKNSKENGQFHSVWLSMMYPRLFLARNLLRDDGVIFISIDDNEVHNLRMVMNEIFGEENFEGQIHWRRRHNQPNDPTKMIALVAEHILVFSKDKEVFKKSGVGKVDLTGDYSNPDNDPKGDWSSKPWKVGSDQSGSRYKIKTPTGKIFDEEWMGDEQTYNDLIKNKRILFPKNGDGFPRKKYYRFERESEGQSATNWWPHEQFGNNQAANDLMTKLFGTKNIFDNPKPIELIRGLIQISNAKNNDIILDFFAGACTTAHAVFDINSEDSEQRKFICVQLPELCKENEEAFKAGYKTIAEVGKDRIRKAIKYIKAETKINPDLFSKVKSEIDLGFKVFKLKESNFKVWRSDVIEGKDDLVKQMDMFQEPVKPGAEMNNMMWELLVKSGYELTTKVEEKELSKCPVYIIAEGELAICLSKLTETAVKEILKLKPKKVICLDSLFERNDKLKTNTALQMKDAGVEFKTI
jgi:adenine-specific DNA-methyltransferase